MEEKNFFKKVWTSITDFEAYEELAISKTAKTILYIMLLTLIFTIIIVVAITIKLNINIGEAKNYIDEKIENITYKDKKLEVKPEKPIIIESEENIIPILIVDTKNYENNREQKAKRDEYEAKVKAYRGGIIILDDSIIIQNPLINENKIQYSELPALEIANKQELQDFLTGKNLIIMDIIIAITMLICIYPMCLAVILLDILFLGIIGKIFGILVKLRLKYKATFNIGAYAITLPLILQLIYIVVKLYTGFEIKYFQWMYTSISYIYVFVAILMIKTEIIHQRLELIKLEQIQKQEAQKAEEQPEKQKEPPKKEDKEENKKEKKEETGEAPEGSNA